MGIKLKNIDNYTTIDEINIQVYRREKTDLEQAKKIYINSD